MATLGWGLLGLILLLAGCDSGGQPGTPQNHPLLWTVGLAFAVLCIGGGLWMLGGAIDRWQRRHERREDRRERSV
jgi:hypothetical protein